MRLAQKVACITGAGSGQGRASAILFAKEGSKVIVSDIDLKGAEETVESIVAAGGEAMALQIDVSREDQVARMVEETVRIYGRMDILFNNAGVGASSSYVMASVVETPLKDFQAVLGINLGGVFFACKHALPQMEKQGGGVIINNSSINALVAMPGHDAYTASKGGIVSLTRALAVEWAQKGIRINCICPGGVDTPMIAGALEQPGVSDLIVSQIPMGRLARPEEIANTALFLASDASSYITGAIIPVDGGWTAK